jgi:hypothetical protein
MDTKRAKTSSSSLVSTAFEMRLKTDKMRRMNIFTDLETIMKQIAEYANDGLYFTIIDKKLVHDEIIHVLRLKGYKIEKERNDIDNSPTGNIIVYWRLETDEMRRINIFTNMETIMKQITEYANDGLYFTIIDKKLVHDEIIHVLRLKGYKIEKERNDIDNSPTGNIIVYWR